LAYSFNLPGKTGYATVDGIEAPDQRAGLLNGALREARQKTQSRCVNRGEKLDTADYFVRFSQGQ